MIDNHVLAIVTQLERIADVLERIDDTLDDLAQVHYSEQPRMASNRERSVRESPIKAVRKR